jgi:hypothetical protein
VRSEAQMDLKSATVQKYWDNSKPKPMDYSQIDAAVLKEFSGAHPKIVQDWLPQAEGIFKADPNHQLTSRERKHRRMMWLEKTFGFRFEKKHYQLVKRADYKLCRVRTPL